MAARDLVFPGLGLLVASIKEFAVEFNTFGFLSVSMVLDLSCWASRFGETEPGHVGHQPSEPVHDHGRRAGPAMVKPDPPDAAQLRSEGH